MPANYPNTAPSFTTHNNGDTIDASHVNSVGDEVTAIGSALLTGVTHAIITNGQVAFPAAQNASAGANTLDDYEEGTWTPTIVSLGGGAPTYTTQTGSYVKVGQQVWIGFDVVLATKGTLAAGQLVIGGLPFVTATSASQLGGVSVASFTALTTAVASIQLFQPSAQAVLGIFYVPAAGATGVSILQVSDIGATFQLTGGGVYRASA